MTLLLRLKVTDLPEQRAHVTQFQHKSCFSMSQTSKKYKGQLCRPQP